MSKACNVLPCGLELLYTTLPETSRTEISMVSLTTSPDCIAAISDAGLGNMRILKPIPSSAVAVVPGTYVFTVSLTDATFPAAFVP